jgi:flagellar protein FliS
MHSSTNQHHPSNHGSQAYLRTKVMTASPAELRLMLLDGAIRFAEQARRGYEERDFERAFDGTTKAQNILLELTNSLRHDQAPELCERLAALYTYLYRSLVEASMTRDTAQIDEVVRLLRFERETWQMCLDKLAVENRSAAEGSGATMAAASAATAVRVNPTTTTGALPQGGLSLRG